MVQRLEATDHRLHRSNSLVAVLGRPMREGRFDIAAPSPDYANRYPEYFHADVRFDAAIPAITVPTAWGKLRCAFADGSMFAAANHMLAAQSRKFDRVDYTAPHVESASVSDIHLELGGVTGTVTILSVSSLWSNLADRANRVVPTLHAHQRRRVNRQDRIDVVTGACAATARVPPKVFG